MSDPLEGAYKDAAADHKKVGVTKLAYEAAAAARRESFRVLREVHRQSYHAIGRKLSLSHGRVQQIIKGNKEKP